MVTKTVVLLTGCLIIYLFIYLFRVCLTSLIAFHAVHVFRTYLPFQICAIFVLICRLILVCEILLPVSCNTFLSFQVMLL
jgi:hypothetical protein